jgi:hypothetical protein
MAWLALGQACQASMGQQKAPLHLLLLMLG